MRRTPRLLVLVLALVALLFWIANHDRQRISVDAALGRPAAAGVQTANRELPTRAGLAPMAANPFSTPPWLHRAPAKTVKPAPLVLALPYQFVGRATREGVTQVFISRGERVIAVDQGATLDGQYRVESVSESAIAFLYLPTGTRQVMLLSPPLYGDRRDAAAPRSATLSAPLNANPVAFNTTITR